MSLDARQTAVREHSDLPRLRALLDQAPDGIFVADLEGRYTDVNDAGCAMLGYTREEIVGRSITDLIPAEDAGSLWESREALLTGATHVAEWRLRRKDGSYLPVEISAKILTDGRWQAIVRDVVERNRLVEALRTSEDRLRAALQASPAVVFTQDAELRYTWIHHPKVPFLAEEVVGKTDRQLLPPEEAERLTAIKRRVLGTGVGERTVVRTTIAGQRLYYDLAVEPLRDEDGRIAGVSCASWEITDQRRNEDEQRLLAELGSVLMTATPDEEAILKELGGLVVRDLSDLFLIDLVEKEAVRRLTVACAAPTMCAGAHALQSIHLDRERPHLMYDAVRAGRPTIVTEVTPEYLRSIAQSPEHHAVMRALDMRSILSVPLLARGRLVGAFALISTHPDRRYTDRDLRFAEELASIAAIAVDNARLYREARRAIDVRDEILGVVAHDLRNPIATITMQLSLMVREDGPERRDQGPIRVIHRAASRANALIADILEVARLESGTLAIERAAVPTRGLLDEVYEAHRLQAKNAGLELTVEVAEDVPAVHGEPERLARVLDNLIGNATKFTKPGGRIVVSASRRSGEVLFSVLDTGSGVRPENVPHLFDRFWQGWKTDQRGVGLGLSIVKGIVEAHGGRVWAESEVGRGTTFYFTIPAARG